MIGGGEQSPRQFFQPGSAAAPAASWEPPIDVFESERDLLIVVALPGVDAQDIEISSQAGPLLVPGAPRLPGGVPGTHIAPLEPPQRPLQRPRRLPAALAEVNHSPP